jgi:hypothetical protein
MGRIVLDFAPWIEDPDPPDRLTEEQIRRLAEGARRLLQKSENDLFIITETPHGYTLHEHLDLGYMVLVGERCPSIEAAKAMIEQRLAHRAVKDRYSEEFKDAVAK